MSAFPQRPSGDSVRAVMRARIARRRTREGSVAFIVSMTVSVLAAVGLYALRAASFEVKTSGFERQNAQTHYLSEYGILGGTEEVSGSKAQLYLGLMMDATKRDAGCTSLAPVFSIPGETQSARSLACRRMGALELGNTWKNSTGGQINVLEPYGGNPSSPGSLGSAPLSGDFYIELTDPSRTSPPAGFDLKLNMCFVQMTVSSTGITKPIVNGQTAYYGTSPDTGIFSNEGLETGRARIVAGPVACP
jgi:hypothetical protein